MTSQSLWATPITAHEEIELTEQRAKEELAATQVQISKAFEQARQVPEWQNKSIKTYVISLPSEAMLKRAKKYQPSITAAANEYQLDPALVYAIAQTESAFNPLAKSHIPAFGLMQIVPSSAGLDVNILINKVSSPPLAEQLLNPEENLKFGSAYLHLLDTRYLKNIEDPLSRLYCTIAAYNAGIGNVASAFLSPGEKSIRAAANVINEMSPDEVYGRLLVDLPYEETRQYLKKVNKALGQYRQSLEHSPALSSI